jgi:hypothetical protein
MPGYDKASLPYGYHRKYNRDILWDNATARMELCLARAGGYVYSADSPSNRVGRKLSLAISIIKPGGECATTIAATRQREKQRSAAEA